MPKLITLNQLQERLKKVVSANIMMEGLDSNMADYRIQVLSERSIIKTTFYVVVMKCYFLY